MDIWIVISLFSLVVSSVAVGLSIKGRTTAHCVGYHLHQ